VRVTDNLSLRSREYVISLKGVEISRYELPQGCELAIPTGRRQRAHRRPGHARAGVRHGAFWIPAERAERARHSGYTVVDSVSVLGTHLSELIRRYAHELFSRQDAKRLLDRVAVEHPKVVEDVVPKLLPLATVQRVLQNLLRERVSIRDAVSILEALGEAGGHAQSRAADRVRAPVHPPRGGQAVSEPGGRPACLVRRSVDRAGGGIRRRARRAEQPPFASAATNSRHPQPHSGARPTPETPVVAITSSGARYFLRQLTEPTLPNLFFLAHNEVPPGLRVQSLGNLQ
jgi:flagellar biosynthesis protein FlhA